MTVIAALGVLLSATAPGKTEITVYNQGFALVKEDRLLTLKEGRQTVAVEDVAAMIDPTSVGIRSLAAKDAFSILEQNYQYDLISPMAILNKSIGHRVRFVRAFGNTKEILEGVLLSSPTAIVNPGGQGQGAIATYTGLVIKTDDGRVVLSPTGEIEVTEVPQGLISRPTLLWDLNSSSAGDVPIELSYITRGMTWSADYVMTLDGAGKSDLQGWVTMDNQSGATYENATLKLLAGDVNQARTDGSVTLALGAVSNMAMKGSAMREESLFEYHLYTLQRPATIRNRETKQLSLLEGHGVPVTKRMVLDSMLGYNNYYPGEGEVGTGDLKPQVRIEFVNDQKSGLGMPLPKGRFRIYQRDASGSVQLLGEDNIDHTPKNEKLSLVVGRAFDVVANRLRTNFTRLSQTSTRESFQIEVRNRKETPETVFVMERHWGDWKVTEKSQDFVKRDANTMEFRVDLKPNEVRQVTYTVETRW